MAAPTPTDRVAPTGRQLKNGFKSLITFENDSNIQLWEKSVKPPGYDGGDPNDVTTMHNEVYRTKAPGTELIEMTDATAVVGYDPAVQDAIVQLVNNPQSITITWPDGAQLAFYGYLKSFEPGDLAERVNPEATITIVVTNVDPETCAEEGPVFVPGTGTHC